MLAVLLTLSGCVTMEMESAFDEDGGATHSMAITIDMSELGDLGDLGEGDPFENFDEAEDEANEQGYRVERIEEGDVVGVRIIQDVDDASNLADQLNGMFNAGAAEGEDVSPFSGAFEKDGDDYRIDLTVDGSALTDTAGEDLGDTGELGLSLDTIFEFTYTATLPGEVDEDETNGSVGSDGTVTWDLPLEGSATLTAASSTGSGSSNLVLILVVIGILVLGLIALAAVGFFIFMNRRGATPAPATAEPAGAPAPMPPPPPASYGADQPTQPSMPTVPEAGEPPAAEQDDEEDETRRPPQA